MDRKIIRSVAMGIILGCLCTYFALYLLERLGVTFMAIEDQWGLFLSVIVVAFGFVASSNYRALTAMKTSIDENTKADQELKEQITKQLHEHDKRLQKIEIKLGI